MIERDRDRKDVCETLKCVTMHFFANVAEGGAVNIEYRNIENGNIKFCQESGELKVRFRQKCV